MSDQEVTWTCKHDEKWPKWWRIGLCGCSRPERHAGMTDEEIKAENQRWRDHLTKSNSADQTCTIHRCKICGDSGGAGGDR